LKYHKKSLIYKIGEDAVTDGGARISEDKNDEEVRTGGGGVGIGEDAVNDGGAETGGGYLFCNRRNKLEGCGSRRSEVLSFRRDDALVGRRGGLPKEMVEGDGKKKKG